MVIVDVGSDFKGNYPAQAFKRFPINGGPAHCQENLLRTHSELSVDTRTPTDRAFDDLIRQYFVAFSRPQEVLVLVGLTAATTEGRVSNVAFGHDRTGRFHWADLRKIPMEMI
jgi:DNA helicase-2/ATP-dependent DNA helicase PcrA